MCTNTYNHVPLLPTLFNIYMNEIILKWNQIDIKGISLLTGTKTNTLLFADDPVTTADSEDNLQRRVLT